LRVENEPIVYLLRKTNLSLKEIGGLTPQQLSAIVNEVYFQESVDDYRTQHSVASILAAIYNTIPRKSHKPFKASDFLGGEMPSRNPKTLDQLADRHGIKLPSKELIWRK
jgi:hypothetical protein